MADQRLRPLAKPWAIGLGNYLHLQTFPLHATQVITTAAAYQALFSVISPALSRWLVPETYNELPRRTRINWDSRVVGFFQSIFISAHAISVLLTDPSRLSASVESRLWGYSRQAGTVQAYAAGYFLWDIYLSLKYLSVFGPSPAVHAVAAFVVTMLGFKPFANYYGVNFVLYELSTPFLNIHWMLDKFGMTGSNLQLYNGLTLMASFFGCRLVWGTYQTYLLTTDMIEAWRAGPVPRLLFGVYFLSNTTLTCLNFYWFSKMVEALRKRFEPKKDGEEQ